MLSFKLTLENYFVASFAISDDIIYSVNGDDGGNAIRKFDLDGQFLEKYPAGCCVNYPDDILIGGENQVLVSAVGAKGDDGNLDFGFAVFDSEGNFLHGLHQNQVG